MYVTPAWAKIVAKQEMTIANKFTAKKYSVGFHTMIVVPEKSPLVNAGICQAGELALIMPRMQGDLYHFNRIQGRGLTEMEFISIVKKLSRAIEVSD